MLTVNDLIVSIRDACDDKSTPQINSDESIIRLLNEAQEIACANSQILKTSDLSKGETVSSCILTCNNTPGTVSQILVNNENILDTPVVFNINENVTASLIQNSITSKNLVKVTRQDNILTIQPQAGVGSSYNNTSPVVVQDTNVLTAGSFTGGVDGLCKISVLPNQKEYKISEKILRIRNYELMSTEKPLCVGYKPNFHCGCHSERITHVLYGTGNYELELLGTPKKKDTIRMTVIHLPLKTLTKKSDTFEITDDLARRLESYVLYKIYSKADYEVNDDSVANKHLQMFISTFGENSFGSAAARNNLYFKFGDSN